MHANAYAFVASALATTPHPAGPVVEIGGKNINGTIRDLFPEPYVAIDVVAGPGVDVVADGATYRPARRPAVVVCCEVLEHAAHADAICANAYRMLRPAGVFIVTTATTGRGPHSAVDGGRLRDGEFYRNVTETDARAWLARFSQLAMHFNRETADLYAVAVK